MITLLILLPILGSILLLPIQEDSNQMRQIALTTSLITFFISLFIWYQFDSSITEYQFVSEFLPNNILNISGSELSSMFHFYFGVDGISLYFIFYSTFKYFTSISKYLK